MVEITKDYEAFIKGKKLNVNGKDLFDKTAMTYLNVPLFYSE